MPITNTLTRDLVSHNVSPMLSCTGRASACDSRSHGDWRSGSDRFGWQNKSRGQSGAGQNNTLRNNNDQFESRNDPTLNKNANVIHFDFNEVIFHNDESSVIDEPIVMMTPTISKVTAADPDDAEPILSQDKLSTVGHIVVTKSDSDFEDGIEEIASFD